VNLRVATFSKSVYTINIIMIIENWKLKRKRKKQWDRKRRRSWPEREGWREGGEWKWDNRFRFKQPNPNIFLLLLLLLSFSVFCFEIELPRLGRRSKEKQCHCSLSCLAQDSSRGPTTTLSFFLWNFLENIIFISIW